MSANLPKGYKLRQFQKFTPEQMDLFQNLFQHLDPQSFLSKLAGGDEETFQQMEAPALRQFSELQGNIASRFSGMGSGARRSSGFQNTMSQSAADLAQNLQSQRQGLQQQALKDLMSFSQQLMSQSPYEQFLEKKQRKPSFFEQVMKYGAPVAGAWAGGPGGAAAGDWFADFMVNNLPGSVV